VGIKTTVEFISEKDGLVLLRQVAKRRVRFKAVEKISLKKANSFFIYLAMVDSSSLEKRDREKEIRLIFKLSQKISEAFQLFGSISLNKIKQFFSSADLSFVLDNLCANFPFMPTREKRKFLLIENAEERFNLFLFLLKSADISNKIEGEVSRKTTKSLMDAQRIIILREKIRVIQEELNRLEGGGKESLS